MIKITCTEKKKEKLIMLMADTDYDCPFENDGEVQCSLALPRMAGKCNVLWSCRECVERNIKWEIVDD